jgi:peptidoglycan/LPS O-acetylase OafA/YrhL
MTTEQPAEREQLGAKTRIEFPYLDGVRGIASLAVVILHAFLFTGMAGQAAEELPIIDAIVHWGSLGVPVFIVLSGYVLMLPVMGREGFTLPKGVKHFLRRRGERILPPYYAALAISALLILAVPAMNKEGGTQWDDKIPVTLSGLLAHVFLVHDLFL